MVGWETLHQQEPGVGVGSICCLVSEGQFAFTQVSGFGRSISQVTLDWWCGKRDRNNVKPLQGSHAALFDAHTHWNRI